MKKNLVLLGMMGVGKTTFGNIVAKKQNMEFIDTDLVIEEKNLMTVSKIFFRKEEEEVVLKCLEKKNCVIALGGGSFINKTLRENILNDSISVWLDIDTKTLNARTQWNPKRPLLKKENNQKKLNELYAARKDIYKLANYKIVCDGLSKNSIVKKIMQL